MTKFKLKIENPCRTNWETMSPRDKGRFCESCSKTVVDFTSVSDVQLIKILQTKTAKVCGRFSPEQVDRFFVSQPSTFCYATYATTFSLLSIVFLPQNSVAQQMEPKTEVREMIYGKYVLDEAQNPIDSQIVTALIIKGEVIEHNGEQLPFCNVVLYKDSVRVLETATDFDGEFSFEVPQLLRNDTLILKASFTGYPEFSMTIVPARIKEVIQITMPYDDNLMGDVFIIKNTPWKRFIRWWGE